MSATKRYTSTALQQGTDPADLFGFKMNYNTVDGNTAVANKLYNGNIAETFWSTATDGGFVRNYGYKYDNLNRLKDATYQKSNLVTRMYDENLTYDKNGNIMTLKRNGDNDAQTGTFAIDNLGYAYATNSNKLMSVTDTPASATSGFKDGNTTGDDYVYDANGNMTVDKNKKITSIVYNHLNLPTKIVFPTGNIVYIYNAAGQKVQKVVTENTTVTTTDYLGGYQYKNAVLQFFPTAEGYVKNTPVSGTNTYSYVFNYTDHLGNVRLSYTKNTTTNALDIIEENNYYPFGLRHAGYNTTIVGGVTEAQKVKFGSKELQDELQLNVYDYGARNYDPALGRWMNVDPLAETSRRFSPYVYALNNPVYFIDPDGMEAMSPIYDPSGNFLGTDNKGLKGLAVVMKKEDFQQGMDSKEAERKNLGEKGFKSDKAYSKAANHFEALKNRPDYDGFVGVSEGVNWAKSHPDALNNPTPDNTLYIDASKLDFGNLKESAFDNLNATTPVNLLNTENLAEAPLNEKLRGTVYALGRVNLQLTNREAGSVSVVNDDATDYDWNTGGGTLRNNLIWAEKIRVGLPDNAGFKAYYYGKGTLRK